MKQALPTVRLRSIGPGLSSWGVWDGRYLLASVTKMPMGWWTNGVHAHIKGYFDTRTAAVEAVRRAPV